MKYRVMVDESKDLFGQKEPVEFKICNTRADAEWWVNAMRTAKHFACNYSYYVEEIDG